MPTRPDPERLAALRSLRRAHAVVERQIDHALMTQHELPLTWFEILLALQNSGGRLRIHELAEELMVNKSSLSRQVDRLEGLGWTRRDRSDEDGRGIVVVLTKAGRATWRSAQPTYRKVAQQVLCTHLTDTDLVAVQRVLSKVLTGE